MSRVLMLRNADWESAGLAADFAAPFSLAPYPAAVTAAIISSAEAVPSTPIEFVSRLTEQEFTPGTFDTAFSTRALHAAQLIPVTSNCFILLSFRCSYFISFCKVFTSSSITSSLPSRMFWATQLFM